MIIRYFRSNQPAMVLTTPLIGIIFWLPHFFAGSDAVQFSGYIFEKLGDNIVMPDFVWRLISLIIICIQALYINTIIQRTEIYSKLSHVPILITIVAGTVLSWKGSFDTAMVANLFLLLSINEILKIYHQNSVIGSTFNAGFWIGMATIFEPALLILAITGVIGVLMLRSADWRELFMIIAGALLPTAFVWVICFVSDTPFDIPTHYFHFSSNYFIYSDNSFLRALIFLSGLLFLIAIFYYLRSLRGTIIRVRKMRLVLLYFLITISLVYGFLIFVNTGYYPSQLLLLPAAFILSFFYMHITYAFIPDTWFYGIIVLWGFFVYNLYFV